MTIGVNNGWSHPIRVEKGVLQGDPASPLLFNLCFNTLMKTLSNLKYSGLSYSWGGVNKIRQRSWAQFADDAAIVSSDVKSAQVLVNIFTAWCVWAFLEWRLDKCCTFGMAKVKDEYVQTYPALWVDGKAIPVIQQNEDFCYLGKLFSMDSDNRTAKELMIKKLNGLLMATSKLLIRP